MTMRCHALFIALCCSAFAGCTVQVSKVVVSPGINRSRDLAVTRAACAEVAARYGLALEPPDAWPPGIVEYAQPLPPFGFDGPSLVLNTVDPHSLAVITISSTGVSDSYRHELTSETVAALQHRLGSNRVRSFETDWTDF